LSSRNEDIRLSPTSYVILGCISLFGGEATPYAIKRLVSDTIARFDPYSHSQLYAEPDRLAEAGYLTLRREEQGRRRKIYRLTRKGRGALSEWRAEPVREHFELHDPAVLKLFFGADPRMIAEGQIETLGEELRRAEVRKRHWEPVAPEGPRLAADWGIAVRRAVLAFWSELAERG
jgi:DNA-binding PadR family transcriptional regulator